MEPIAIGFVLSLNIILAIRSYRKGLGTDGNRMGKKTGPSQRVRRLSTTFTFPTMEIMSMSLRRQLDEMPKGVPLPSHRHATPSGPWPWMDVDSEETHHPQRATPCPHQNCDICP